MGFIQEYENMQNKQNDCVNLIIDNDFSSRPLGRKEFTRTYLTDTLFKNINREESVFISKGNENQFFLRFYSGNNTYVFIKNYDKETFRLSSAIITDGNNRAMPIKSNTSLGINYTKEAIEQIFNCRHVCDTLRIDDKELNSGHRFYFRDNMIYKIELKMVAF